jgi:4-alpha-glucanotransferase
MSKLNFMMLIHNHQPVGNFDNVFEDAYQKSYFPFLEILKKHPLIRMSFHFSGSLLEWLDINHPEIFDLLIPMVESNQIEIISGGFYEPILSVLPQKDAVEQIDKMSEYIQSKFNKTPQGLWLAERVWESDLTELLKTTNINYTFLDEEHFIKAGALKENINGYYRSKSLDIFPINYELRYAIPFKPIDEIEFILKKLLKQEKEIGVTFADDGEKFGNWPGMHDWVFRKGWLNKFFKFLEKNRDWIEMPLFSEYIKNNKPTEKINIPAGSYNEMSEWIPDGIWKNFFNKYPESNNMYNKMLRVSKKVNSLPESTKKDKALNFLYKAQCNCAYWHGVFGGLYLNHLRFAVYSNLIQAEKNVDELVLMSTAKQSINKIASSLAAPRNDEAKVIASTAKQSLELNTNKINLYISPQDGGSIFELDYKPTNFNFSDVLTRRFEKYHEQSNSLIYDKYTRASLIDHVITPETKINDFINMEYKEVGDFYNNEYSCEEEKNDIILQKTGSIEANNEKLPFKITKTIKIQDNSITFDYCLENKSKKDIDIVFGIDFVFTLLAGNASDRHYYIPGIKKIDTKMQSKGELKEVSEIQAIDDWMRHKLVFNFSDKCRLWRFPIQTVSNSESGIETTYQGSVLFPNWNIKLKQNEQWKTTITQEIISWE